MSFSQNPQNARCKWVRDVSEVFFSPTFFSWIFLAKRCITQFVVFFVNHKFHTNIFVLRSQGIIYGLGWSKSVVIPCNRLLHALHVVIKLRTESSLNITAFYLQITQLPSSIWIPCPRTRSPGRLRAGWGKRVDFDWHIDFSFANANFQRETDQLSLKSTTTKKRLRRSSARCKWAKTIFQNHQVRDVSECAM